MLTFKFQFIAQNRRTPDPVSSGAGADGISLRTETHWQRALPAKHQFVAVPLPSFYHIAEKKKRKKGLPLSEGYGMIAENNSGLSRRDLRIAF